MLKYVEKEVINNCILRYLFWECFGEVLFLLVCDLEFLNIFINIDKEKDFV